MRINADFSQPVVVHPEDREWVPSPSGGVERCMLDRIGDEVARATSFVRFAAGASFPTHRHDGGEEYLVLSGTFSDDTGDFPADTYVRNPIGTAHAPHTDTGCTIFVKLWQFAEDDRAPVAVSIADKLREADRTNGQAELVLHQVPGECVRVIDLDANASYASDGRGGTELLVLEGSLGVERDESMASWPAGTWARWPAGEAVRVVAGVHGTRIWVKTGHLDDGVVDRFESR